MIEAWNLRGLQRQKLMEELMHLVYGLEDKEGDLVLFEIIHILVEYFQAKKENLYDAFLLAKAISMHGPVYELVFKNILPKTESFARAKEETDFLIAELLKKILNSALGIVYSAKSSLEIHNPQLIFHAPSAMTEVEMPEE